MKYLGIDYGTKNIGLATSDPDGRVAFPHSVIANDTNTFNMLSELITSGEIETIVVGESIDHKGNDNEIMQEISDFIAQLSLLTPIPIHTQEESFSSTAARVPMEKGDKKSRQKKGEVVDDQAAAIILQRFLDKQGNN